MNDTAKVALAIAAGYYLGRRHKLRLASAMAAGLVARRLRRDGGLLKQGGKLLDASPQLGEMTQRLRGQLVEATKAAAVAAATRQIEALTERLEERADSLRPEAEGREEPHAEEPRVPKPRSAKTPGGAKAGRASVPSRTWE